MTEKHTKRPRDLNQWAKRMVDIATGEVEEKKPLESASQGGRAIGEAFPGKIGAANVAAAMEAHEFVMSQERAASAA